MNDLCILAHARDPERPRHALDGLYTCHGHTEELRRLIAEMPAHHDELRRPASPPGGHHGNGGGIAIDDACAGHRSHMTAVMASWARVVAEDRGITPPSSPALPATCPWLLTHLEWCCAQPWVDEMLTELRRVTRTAIALTDIPARRVKLGERCLIHAGGQRCDGTITIVAKGDDWWADCSECDEPQDVTGYMRGTGWVDVAGVIRLAAMFGLPCTEEVVRQWRHRKRIKAKDEDGRAWYGLASVHDYLSRRTRTVRERMAG